MCGVGASIYYRFRKIGMKWNRHIRKKGGVVIIGDSFGIGKEFARLVLADKCPLVLVDHPESKLIEAKHELQTEFTKGHIYLISEDLSQNGVGASIYDAVLLYQLLSTPPFQVDLLINVLEFQSPRLVDPWQDGLEPNYNLGGLLNVVDLFYQDMMTQGEGEIINVLVKPIDQDQMLDMVFEDTRIILNDQIRENRPDEIVRQHTLSYTPKVLSMHSASRPQRMAHDHQPKPYSPSEAAGFGFKAIGRKRRRMR